MKWNFIPSSFYYLYRMRFSGCLFIIILVLFVSCDDVDTTQNPLVYDYGYFPVDSGNWHEYSVLSINIDKAIDVYDTSNYYLREQVGGIFVDAANDTMLLLNRYYKDSLHKDWQLLSAWYLGVVRNEAVEVEENIKYIKQKFPLELNKTWNGNAYNRTDTLGEFMYTVSAIDEPDVVNALSFEKVLTITQREFTSAVEKYLFYEKYAYGIGLIKKEMVDIYSEDVDLSIPIEDRVTKGTMYYQEIIDYGKAN